jgi:hypothetical protein
LPFTIGPPVAVPGAPPFGAKLTVPFSIGSPSRVTVPVIGTNPSLGLQPTNATQQTANANAKPVFQLAFNIVILSFLRRDSATRPVAADAKSSPSKRKRSAISFKRR